MSAFYHSLRFFKHDIGNLNVFVCFLVKSRGNYLSFHVALHISHLLRTFVNQQDDLVYLGMIGSNSVGNVLQQHRFPGFRLRYDHSTLSLSNGRE